jgi:hypothetical protein
MSYQYGQTTLRPQAAKTNDEMRVELENLNRLRAAILAETEAKEKELARIRTARKRLIPISTNEPTPEALAYREKYGHIIAQMPAPTYGGRDGLRMAAAEADRHQARKRGAE